MTGARTPDALEGSSDRAFVGPLLIVAVFLWIVWPYRGFIPYWDSRVYFGCIADAVQKPFDLLNFRCVGHPSIVYLFLLGLTQYLAPWNVSLTYAANALLGAASIVAFHALLRVLFPNRPAAEYGLVTALYALAPLFLVHAIFLNLDYGTTVFFVLFLYFLFARRFWTATVFAIAMMFSKEVGAAAYTVTVAAYVIAFTIRTPRSWTARFAELRLQAPLLAAPFVLAAYVVSLHVLQSDPGQWLDSYVPTSIVRNRLDYVLSVNPADATIRSFAADIFILNFQWLYTGVLIAASCMAVARTVGRGSIPAREAVTIPGAGLFFALLLPPLVYAATRYRDYNNARYVLIVSPVLIAAFHGALLSVFTNATARRLFLTVTAAVVLVSNFRTLDFGSKAVFGTFTFGSHALLDMPSLIGGLKMDSIVYNLESLQFNYLLNDLMQDLRPAPQTVLFMGDTTYNFPPRVDARSYALTVDPSHTLPLSVLSDDRDLPRNALRKHITGDGDRFFYMAFANADNHQLRLLQQQYPLVGTKHYDRSGYTLDLYTFRFTATP